jgi:hypothetical protein
MIRKSAPTFTSLSCVALALGAFACSSAPPNAPLETTVGGAGSAGSGSADGTAAPSGSEVAVSTVSGALNNNSGTGVALLGPQAPKRTLIERAFAALNPIGTAYAADWSCSGDTLTPRFDGPGSYAFTPASCSVTWPNGKRASSSWSAPFTLDYGTGCDSSHPVMEAQDASCELTRTSATGGTTRTITGPDGNTYAIDHDTNGAGTGWDSTVSPAPSDDGVQVSCGTGGCIASRTLVISGSHLTGTVDIDGHSTTIWDHTVTTGSGGISVTGAAAERVVSGSITVQHNLIHATSTTTFSAVHYGEPLCCFPTDGTVSTTYSQGSNAGKTESMTFGSVCGEVTLTSPDGSTSSLTLQHCL